MAIVFDAQGNLVDTEGRIQFNDSVYQSDPFGRFGLDYNPGSIGDGINQDYLGKGMTVSSMGVGPNLNYLGKGMQLGSFGDPEQIQYRPTGIQTIFPTNALPALSDLGGMTPNFGVAEEEDVEQVDYLGSKRNKFQEGIAKLFEFFQRFSPVAAISRGIESLRDKRNTREAIKKDILRDTQGGPIITFRNLKQQQQDKIDDRGRGQILSRTTSAPKRSFSKSYSDAKSAFTAGR